MRQKILSFVKPCFLVPLMLPILIFQHIDEKAEQHVRLSMQFVLESLSDVLYVQVFCLDNAEINALLPAFIAALASSHVERKISNQLKEDSH